MSTPSNEYDTYIPVYNDIPENWEESRQFLVEQTREMTNGINAREVAIYVEDEQLTGGQFVKGTATPPQFRNIFRKVVPFGALPNAGAKSVPHNITLSPDTLIIKHHAWGNDLVGNLSIPIPYVNVLNPADGVQIERIGANITITTTTGNYINYTSTFVILEYIQEP